MRPVLPLCLALAAAFSPAVAASATLTGDGSLVLAQRDRDRDRERGDRDERRDERGRGDERGRRDERREGPHGVFRGERVPEQFRHRAYVVDDWRMHRLHAPPRGYHWVQIGADFALAVIATGIIAEVVAGSQPAAVVAPPVASAPPGAPWYFCRSANAYYPYVNACPEGWQVVPAQPR